jgi:phage-related protein
MAWSILAELYPYRYNPATKPIQFLGDALERWRAFPPAARQDVEHQPWKVQRSLDLARARFAQIESR